MVPAVYNDGCVPSFISFTIQSNNRFANKMSNTDVKIFISSVIGCAIDKQASPPFNSPSQTITAKQIFKIQPIQKEDFIFKKSTTTKYNMQ